jgi:2-methylcitrate dehydratase PrpD
LPAALREAGKRAVLDWLGSAIAGSPSPPGRMVLAVVESLGGRPQASLVGGPKLPVTSAALYNGAVSHVVELDDVHRASISHPAAVVIPAALAVAELVDADGPAFLAAVAAGYEAVIRIGEAVTPSHYKYWHTTGTCGTFGAAAAAAKLLGLGAEGIASALGSAGTQAAGLWEFLADGAMSKHLHPGKAAMNGVLSALLAQQGFTSAARILEGEKGFFVATAAAFDPKKVTAGFGSPYKLEEVSFKVHASCRHTHPAIDAVLAAMEGRDLDPADVASVTVETYSVALGVTADHQPTTVYSAKFSLPFCVALAIHRGSAGLADFSEAGLWEPRIRETMGRVELRADPALEAIHPARWPARVTIRTRGGRTLTGSVEDPRGDPENPVSTSELEDKFRALAGPVIGPTAAEGLIEASRNLDGLTHLRQLTALFPAAVGRPGSESRE